MGICTPMQYMVPLAYPTQPPNVISIGLAVFARLTSVTNIQKYRQTTQTDRLRYDDTRYVAIGRYRCNAA